MTHEGQRTTLTWENHNHVLGIHLDTNAIEEQFRMYQEGVRRFISSLETTLRPFPDLTVAFQKLPVKKDKPAVRHTKALLTKNIHVLPKETGNGRSRSRSKPQTRTKDHTPGRVR